MDFFAQQDKARRNTFWLVLLFTLAVLSLTALTNVLIGLVVWFFTQQDAVRQGVSLVAQTDSRTIASLFSWKTFGLISLGVGGGVLCAILYKWLQLSSGGKAVAESLGGVRIHPNTDDPDQRQVLNVVEEMALASGMPVPAVYLLEEEQGINAFAAGNTPADAVIGVTQGCIHHFKRDELQGVIAHEFSHILNGDMRLNLRLIALLHGIVFIGLVGEMLMRGSSSNRRSDGRVALLGIAMMVIGWIGVFFGNLIKAAVSRQREFLADASAVQFTRNPEGISNALKLIGGYQNGTEIHNAHRSEVSHLFFGQAVARLSNMLATHPPLVERILKLDPDWDGNYLHRGQESRQQKQQQDEQSRREVFSQAVLTGAAVAAGVDPLIPEPQVSNLDQVRSEIDAIPDALYAQAKDPLGAIALCFALLLDQDEGLRKTQMHAVSQSGFKGVDRLVEGCFGTVNSLDPRWRLPLIELLLPALKSMSAPQYKAFKRVLMLLIRADQQTSLFEWCLFQLVRHYLAGEHEPDKQRKAKYREPAQVADEYRCVLSVLAHYGHTDPAEAERAFNRGAGAAGLYNLQIIGAEEIDLDQFMQAVNTLGNAYPMLKPRLLAGLSKCIAQDGEITVIEREIVTSIAAVMDSPVPRFAELT